MSPTQYNFSAPLGTRAVDPRKPVSEAIAKAAIAAKAAAAAAASAERAARRTIMEAALDRRSITVAAPARAVKLSPKNLLRFPSFICLALAFLALPKSKFKSLSTKILGAGAVLGSVGFLISNKDKKRLFLDIQNIFPRFSDIKDITKSIPNSAVKDAYRYAGLSFALTALFFKYIPLSPKAKLSTSYLLSAIAFSLPPKELSEDKMNSWRSIDGGESGKTNQEISQSEHDIKIFAALTPVLLANLLTFVIPLKTISSLIKRS